MSTYYVEKHVNKTGDKMKQIADSEPKQPVTPRKKVVKSLKRLRGEWVRPEYKYETNLLFPKLVLVFFI